MKTTFDDYTIPCTEEQTKKALELGAPIKLRSDFYNPPGHYLRLYNHPGKYFIKGYHYAKCPTAEQMIGWLEEQEIFIEITRFCKYAYRLIELHDSGETNLHMQKEGYSSHKEATLAAIDAALEYLKNCKDCK